MKHDMKKISHLLCLAASALLLTTSCMNDFDDMTFADGHYPYGNNAIPANAPITTIQDLKTVKYGSLFNSTAKYNYAYTTIDEDLYIKGYIVSNDESGNVYKTLAIQDETGAVVLGVNATGLYSYLPMGQQVILSLKGLDFGAYSNMPEIGKAYETEKYGLQLGRMSQKTFESHVRLVGTPDTETIKPTAVDAAWLKGKGATATNYPLFVTLEGTFADAGKPYSPTDGATENRVIKVGGQSVICRMSNYSNFATDTIPSGTVRVTGLLTLYGSDKQMLVRVVDDIQPMLTDLPILPE